jgi:hypothetical protein
LWPLCVFGCVSTVVVEGACVRDFRRLEVCTVGTVGQSAGGECVGGRGDRLGKDRREAKTERVDNNGQKD